MGLFGRTIEPNTFRSTLAKNYEPNSHRKEVIEMPRRVPIESLTQEHGPQYLEEAYPDEPLERALVYVDPARGKVYEAQQGHKVRDLPSNVIELPRTTWF